MKLYIRATDVNNYSYTGSGFLDDGWTVYTWNNEDEYGYYDEEINLVLDSRIWYVEHIYHLDQGQTKYWTYPLKDVDQALAKLNEVLEEACVNDVITREDVDQWTKYIDVNPKFTGLDDMIRWYSGAA